MTAHSISTQLVYKDLDFYFEGRSQEEKYDAFKIIELTIKDYGEALVRQVMDKAIFDTDEGIVLKEPINY